MGLRYLLPQALEHPDGKPEGLEIDEHLGVIDDSNDDLLAAGIGERGDAQVDRSAVHHHVYAAVLGQTTLGNVQPRHDFDARHDGGHHLVRWCKLFVEHAVDAIANAKGRVVGLDVYVAGPFLDGGVDEKVD